MNRIGKNAEELEKSFIEDEWNCGLLSVCDALSTMGMNITYKQMFSSYANLGFKIYSFGISSVHVALLIRTYHFHTILRTNSKWLKELWDSKERNPLFKAEELGESKDTLRAMKMLTSLGGKIYFYSENTYPNIRNVISAFKKGSIVALCVNANHYYSIHENWNHYLVLSKDGTTKFLFKIKDSLENIGKMYYPDWDNYLKNAMKYNWSTWSGDMIEIYRNNQIQIPSR